MADTETYTEYGVFLNHGSAQILYTTFRKAETVGIWRRTQPADVLARITSIRTREVTIQRGAWSVVEGSE
ncbi:hypothetical protein [Kribbella deserti]|uniref:Uncharacterized protein n=1 Tax=Kribbella deserti TaxID=1926257 RepID=A0ABV6QR96_9ACTN